MPIVETSYGKVHGRRLGDGLFGFFGIPYAAPPIGSLRWRPPEPPASWASVRDAEDFGNDAIQGKGKRTSRAPGMSEDCLYLNIWAPEEQKAGGWPVIVWSGGGGFNTGGGAFESEDLSRLASRGAVLVSFNYRLGIFGFFAHPALSAESPHGSSGNYGLLDHIAALRWVRENISQFGGDESRITYVSESSGSAAGALILTSDLGRNAFDRAVLQSPGSYSPLLPLEDAERTGAPLGETADEIRSISAEDLPEKARLLSAAQQVNLSVARPMRPIVDGWAIKNDQAFMLGAFKAVPLIIGSNEDEGRFFTRRMTISRVDEYQTYLKNSFADSFEDALKHYPAETEVDVATALSDAYGDISINYPVERLARAFAQKQSEVFRYVYTYRPGGTTESPTHSEEADTLLDTRPHENTADAEMAAAMGKYWLQFAEAADPNTPELPDWPRFDEKSRQYMKLDQPLSVGSAWRAEEMEFVAAAAH